MSDMAEIRNVRPDHDVLVEGRLVLRGATIEVAADQVYGFTSQTENWAPADDEAQEAHDAAAGHVPVVEGELPPKNARLAEWQAYARTRGATEDDLHDKTRGDLVALYSTEG